FVAISRAALSKLQTYEKRMGWSFKWLSSGQNDFNYDYGASFRPEDTAKGNVVYNYKKDPKMSMADREGMSVFSKDDKGQIFHTYSSYARGIDILNGAYNWLD